MEKMKNVCIFCCMKSTARLGGKTYARACEFEKSVKRDEILIFWYQSERQSDWGKSSRKGSRALHTGLEIVLM